MSTAIAGVARIKKRGEVSANFRGSRNSGKLRQPLPDAQALVVSKEEQLILDDRPAQRKSELVLLVGLLAKLVELVRRVDFFVAEKFPNIAVNWLVPDLITAFMIAPLPRPNSAL